MKGLPQHLKIISLAASLGILLSACGTKDVPVAQVGSETIKTSDIDARMNAITDPAAKQDPTTRTRVLDSLVREKVIAAMAEKAGMEKSQYLKHLMATELTVSEKEVAQFHQDHPEQFVGIPNRKAFIRATLQRQKFDAWLTQAKTTIPVKIDEAAAASK